MFTKALIAGIFVAFAAASASAQDLDFGKITCKDFATAPKDQVGRMLAWLEGYYTKESDPPILYADKAAKDAKALSAYCNDNPTESLNDAADAVMPVK